MVYRDVVCLLPTSAEIRAKLSFAIFIVNLCILLVVPIWRESLAV
jgi:hypothetical protein